MSERAPLAARIASALSKRDAVAFVHTGSARDPAVRYCLQSINSSESAPTTDAFDTTHAIAFDSSRWHHVSQHGVPNDWPQHPADELATRLADGAGSGTVLTPASIPHDGALFLEQAGFSLASSDVLTRSRRSKTDDERARIERTQQAGGAGVKRAAAMLAEAATGDDGMLVLNGENLTSERIRIATDKAVTAAGSLPGGHTRVTATTSDDALQAGEPIVVAVSPRGLEGYHGGLVRTFVVDGDGGDSRRANVALTQAFRSVQSMLTDATHSVTAVEADLGAEIRAYGFGDGDDIKTRVTGVGLESREAPSATDADVGPETVVRIGAAVQIGDERSIRLADLLVPGQPAQWLEAPSRSLDPAAYVDETS